MLRRRPGARVSALTRAVSTPRPPGGGERRLPLVPEAVQALPGQGLDLRSDPAWPAVTARLTRPNPSPASGSRVCGSHLSHPQVRTADSGIRAMIRSSAGAWKVASPASPASHAATSDRDWSGWPATATQAATADLAGAKPGAARGGAHGVTGSGSSAWQKLVTDFADWNDKAGWGLNSWGAFGAVLTLRAEASYGGAAAKLSSASAAEDEAFWKWYSREGSYFDWQPKATAYNAAASGATDALKDLRESIVPGKGLMGTLGKVGLVAGIGSDIVTEIAPSKSFGPDGLLGGNTDRVMAGANMAASGLALGGSMEIGAATTLLAVPGVDVVVGGVLVGTAVYFGGEFVYRHWSGIEHGVSSAADTAGHALGSAASWVGGELGL